MRKDFSSLFNFKMSLSLMSGLELMLITWQVAGAAAFGAFKYYEDQQRKEGMPPLLHLCFYFLSYLIFLCPYSLLPFPHLI